MAELKLSTGFLWKQGFLTHKQQWKNTIQDPTRGEGKRTKPETPSHTIQSLTPQLPKSAMRAVAATPNITPKCSKQVINQRLTGLLTSAHMTYAGERETNTKANAFTKLRQQSSKKCEHMMRGLCTASHRSKGYHPNTNH